MPEDNFRFLFHQIIFIILEEEEEEAVFVETTEITAMEELDMLEVDQDLHIEEGEVRVIINIKRIIKN